MKVLITGIAGFLGTHLAEYFKKKGWEVIGIDNLNDFELKRAKFDVGKSRQHNSDFLRELEIDFSVADAREVTSDDFQKMDLIIHCAAQPAMTIAIEHPKYDFQNNAEAVVNMLDIAKYHKAAFINCSSVHVYGNATNESLYEDETRFRCVKQQIDEEEPILQGAVTPLHASKRTTELYTQAFAETYDLRAVSFRLTGMYGERQFGGMDHGWVANFAIRNMKGRPITIFGSDKQVRDILYAQDVCKAFEMWFDKGKSGIYNLGGGLGQAISLGECLTEISKQTSKSNNITVEPARFGDMYYFVCDYRKAKEDFGWVPETVPEEGIKKLLAWIKKNEDIL